MWFFKTFYRCLFDIEWLRTLRKYPRVAWGYATVFIVVIAILQILPTALFALPRGFHEVELALKDTVPDFTANVRGGTLSVEKLAQPFVHEQKTDDSTFRVAVDTVSTSTVAIESYIKDKDHDAVLLFSRDAVSYYDGSDGQTQVEQFAGSPDSTFTKGDLTAMFDKLKKFGVPLLGVLLTLAFVVFSYLGKLLSLLGLTLIIYVVVRARKLTWSFKDLWTVGLFALTLPTLIQSIGRWLALPLGPLYTIVFLFLMFAVVFGEKKETATPPAAPTV